MLIFDQLRISDDGKRLYINLHVNTADYFSTVTLDSLTIITADKVSETNCVPPTDDYIYKKTYTTERQEDLVIDKSVLDAAFINTSGSGPTAKVAFTDADFSKTLFFVYVKCKAPVGTYNVCLTCDSDNFMTTLGVTFDENMYYQKVMDYTKELAKDCTIPTSFTDFILLWNAFKASVETEHYIPAIKYWNMLFGVSSTDSEKDGSHSPYGGSYVSTMTKPCGCNG